MKFSCGLWSRLIALWTQVLTASLRWPSSSNTGSAQIVSSASNQIGRQKKCSSPYLCAATRCPTYIVGAWYFLMSASACLSINDARHAHKKPSLSWVLLFPLSLLMFTKLQPHGTRIRLLFTVTELPPQNCVFADWHEQKTRKNKQTSWVLAIIFVYIVN